MNEKIKKAFYQWYKEQDKKPSNVYTNDEWDKFTTEEKAELSAEYFINLLNAQD